MTKLAYAPGTRVVYGGEPRFITEARLDADGLWYTLSDDPSMEYQHHDLVLQQEPDEETLLYDVNQLRLAQREEDDDMGAAKRWPFFTRIEQVHNGE